MGHVVAPAGILPHLFVPFPKGAASKHHKQRNRWRRAARSIRCRRMDAVGAERDAGAIILFLSTGRCGTQWLAENLGRLYSEDAVVRHEPLGARYVPRAHFRRYDQQEQGHPAAVRDHLDWIEEVSREKLYIETGWPLFATLPIFFARFGDRVRIVHLVRHLVPTAVSHMVHQCYFDSPRRDEYTALATLDPSLPGTIQTDELPRWPTLSPFEKCLFWCTEVHLYARELRDRFPAAAFHRMRAEDLFAGDEPALRTLMDFLCLPYQPSLAARSSERIDQWHHRTELEFDWREIFGHPMAVELSRSLGYDLDRIDQDALDHRYKGAPTPGPTG